MAKILVVDDDPQATGLIGKLLLSDNHQPTLLNNSMLAMSKADEIQPDLFILDLMMPGLNGFEICQMLHDDQRFQRIPVIIVSAMDDSISKETAFKAGARAFVPKPFMPDDLFDQINKLLS